RPSYPTSLYILPTIPPPPPCTLFPYTTLFRSILIRLLRRDLQRQFPDNQDLAGAYKRFVRLPTTDPNSLRSALQAAVRVHDILVHGSYSPFFLKTFQACERLQYVL